MQVVKTKDLIELIDGFISDYDDSVNYNHIAIVSQLKSIKNLSKNVLSFEVKDDNINA